MLASEVSTISADVGGLPTTGAQGATYSSRVVSGWLEHARSEGFDVDALCDRVGLSLELVRDPDARIKWRVVEGLLGDLVPQTDGLMPFRYVANIRRGQFGLIGFLVRHSPTLGESLDRLRRFWRINNQLVHMELERGQVACLHGRFAVPVAEPMQRFSSQLFTAHVLRLARKICGRDWNPIEIRYPFDEPDEGPRYAEELRAKVVFGADRSALVMNDADLERPVAGADPMLAQELTRYAEMLLSKLPEVGNATSNVRRMLIDMMPDAEPRIEIVARALALSTRSLQRQLRAEGTSFSGLLDQVRHQVSLEHLDNGRSVEEIAFVLGFSRAAAFQRAFKRWTGMSPREYKKRRG